MRFTPTFPEYIKINEETKITVFKNNIPFNVKYFQGAIKLNYNGTCATTVEFPAEIQDPSGKPVAIVPLQFTLVASPLASTSQTGQPIARLSFSGAAFSQVSVDLVCPSGVVDSVSDLSIASQCVNIGDFGMVDLVVGQNLGFQGTKPTGPPL